MIAGYFVFSILWNIISMIIQAVKQCILRRKATQFRAARDAKINTISIPIPKVDRRTVENVLNSDVVGLKKMLAANNVSSEELLNIFARRAQEFGIEYGIITHIKYTEALIEAKKCDQLRRDKSPLINALLFGIPISIKETFEEKGIHPHSSLLQIIIITILFVCNRISFYNWMH